MTKLAAAAGHYIEVVEAERAEGPLAALRAELVALAIRIHKIADELFEVDKEGDRVRQGSDL